MCADGKEGTEDLVDGAKCGRDGENDCSSEQTVRNIPKLLSQPHSNFHENKESNNVCTGSVQEPTRNDCHDTDLYDEKCYCENEGLASAMCEVNSEEV